MRALTFPKVVAVPQMFTVQIPFIITLYRGDLFIAPLKKFLSSRWPWWGSCTIEVPWFVRGIIKFYDVAHGYLDHGDFVNVPLTGRSFGWWFWRRIELYGTLPNIGRYCFSGWGNCEMTVYDEANTTIMKITGRVVTELKGSA